MQRFFKVSGMESANPNGLPVITRTPEGLALGNIPGWQVMLDPDYADVGSIRNRAQPRDNAPVSSAVTFSSFASGATAFAFSGDELPIPSKGVVNGHAWTVFSVMQPTANASNVLQRLVRPDTPVGDNSDLALNIGWTNTGNGVVIYEDARLGSGHPTRILHNGVGLITEERPRLLMFTGSTRDGLRIFDGGQQIAQAPSDKRPLVDFTQGGDLQWFRQAAGLYGMTGLLSVDLGWPEHAGYRRAIERFCFDKYGITPAA